MKVCLHAFIMVASKGSNHQVASTAFCSRLEQTRTAGPLQRLDADLNVLQDKFNGGRHRQLACSPWRAWPSCHVCRDPRHWMLPALKIGP